MANRDARDAFSQNQTLITSTCFILAAGGIVLVMTSTFDSKLAYSFIPLGIAVLSWFLSVLFGIFHLKNKGNFLGAVSDATEDNPVNVTGLYKSRYLSYQVSLFIVGGIFILLYWIWRILSNSISSFPQ